MTQRGCDGQIGFCKRLRKVSPRPRHRQKQAAVSVIKVTEQTQTHVMKLPFLKTLVFCIVYYKIQSYKNLGPHLYPNVAHCAFPQQVTTKGNF